MCHTGVNLIPPYKWLKSECAVALPPQSAVQSDVEVKRYTCLVKSSVTQCGGDRLKACLIMPVSPLPGLTFD